MKAVVCQNAELRVDDIAEPVPGPGQVLVIELSIGTQEKLRKLPVPWHVTRRLAERLGIGAPKRPVSSRASVSRASCSRSSTARR